MAKQIITFGTPPTGIGGDSYRTAFGKCNENFTELYDKIAYFEGAPKAASSFTIYRDVLSNYRSTASLTGALVIHLPKAKNKSSTMVSFKIRGFNYLGNKGEWLLQVGGYNYTSGWTQCSANLNGPAPFTQVQLGMASDHQVIIVGTVSTVWAYPRFNIEEITASYSNHATGWNTDITAAYETDLSAYTGIVTPTLYGWPQVLTAEKLTTARTIGGVSFDGSANINLPGVNTAGNQNTSGNAATATKLATARTINGVSFDGSANITIADSTKLPLTGGTLTGALNGTTAVFSGSVQVGNGIQSSIAVSFLNGGSVQNINTGGVLVSNSYSDASKVPSNGIYSKGGLLTGTTTPVATLAALGQGATTPITTDHVNVGTTYGYVPMLSGSTQSSSGYRQNISIGAYRPQATWTGSAVYIATGGNDNSPTEAFLFELGRRISHTGGAITLVGNADTATKLTTARTINGVAFDGTANITIADSTKVPLSGGTMTGNLSVNALGVSNNSNSSGLGISLYNGANGGMPSYGLAFSGTATFGTHGSVVGDWATYFTMSGATNRGWIFKSGNGAGGNVASISAAGEITATSILSSGNITAFSDARLKDNITEIPDALNKLNQLKGVTYTRKDLASDKQYAGLIAQDVQKVLPEAVVVTEDDIISVDYNGVIGLLVEAIKELESKVAALGGK